MLRGVVVVALAACGFRPAPATSSTPDAAPDAPAPITCGQLTCDPHATCSMPGTGPTCTCANGYSGDGMTCTAVDPCATGNGGCMAACVMTGPGTRSCYTPKTCADVAAKITLANDTSVTLYANADPAKPWIAFCHGGLEYLTLPAGATSNYGQYTHGGKSPGTDVRTGYARVRLDPATLKVDICDQTFATSTGALMHDPAFNGNDPVTSMPLGSAMDCAGPNSQTGVAKIDLTGAPFVVTATWQSGGNSPGISLTTTGGGRTVSLTGGGDCGWFAPKGSPGNPFNTFQNAAILGLAYMQ
jgi:hypothetical protein